MITRICKVCGNRENVSRMFYSTMHKDDIRKNKCNVCPNCKRQYDFKNAIITITGVKNV
jgi:predicted  nucleic acid-binding Zn ribbon protein